MSYFYYFVTFSTYFLQIYLLRYIYLVVRIIDLGEDMKTVRTKN